MFTPELPADVAALIAPIAEAIVSEVRADVMTTERPRLAAIGQRAVQYHGDEYRAGVANILAASVGGGVPVRNCECEACEDLCCEGQCDPCDERDCEQHGCGDSPYACCGYCTNCQGHHDDYEDEVIVVRTGRCVHVYCRDCDHVCDD